MQITIRTESGVKVTQPQEKWLVGVIVALADRDPQLFDRILQLVERQVEAPPSKWIAAIVVALAGGDLALFTKVIELVDTKVDAYASSPESVQAALRARI